MQIIREKESCVQRAGPRWGDRCRFRCDVRSEPRLAVQTRLPVKERTRSWILIARRSDILRVHGGVTASGRNLCTRARCEGHGHPPDWNISPVVTGFHSVAPEGKFIGIRFVPRSWTMLLAFRPRFLEERNRRICRCTLNKARGMKETKRRNVGNVPRGNSVATSAAYFCICDWLLG